MPAALALAGLRDVLDRGESGVVLADVDWEQLLARVELVRAPALLGELAEVAQAIAARAGGGRGGVEGSLAARLAGMPEGERERAVLELVREQAAAVLEHASPEAVQDGRTFRELGFDSLAAVQLRNRLAAVTGLRLASSLVFDHPTPAVLAGHLLGEIVGAPSDADAGAVLVLGPVDEPVAIVGMGCRLPGGGGLRGGVVGAAGERRGRDSEVPGRSWLGSGGAVRPRPRSCGNELCAGGRVPV